MKARWYILVLVVIAAIAATGVFVVRRSAPPPKAAQQDSKPAVEEEISLPATLQAVTTIPVPIPIQGKVESFQVDVGAEVYEGQLLALIRSEALNTIQQAAEVDLESAETRVRNLESLFSAARL